MRLIFWLLVAIAFFYAFYSGAMATWSYFQVSTAVEQAVEGRRTGRESMREIHDGIIRNASQSGVPLDARDVEILQNDASIDVRVHWTYPVIVYGDEVVLAVPLSLNRSFRR